MSARRRYAWAAAWGPGLLTMLADTDAGNVVTAAESGARFGYRLLPLILLLTPLLFMLQDLAVRLGLFGGQGFAAAVRARFGLGWALAAVAALTVATLGSLITELTGIAGVADLFAVPRWLALGLACGALLAVAFSGRHRVIERVAIAIGLFELSFFLVALAARPNPAALLADALHPGLDDPAVLYLTAALIGATFNPWMVFYQASALARRRLGPALWRAARGDTATGALLTQLVTAAVLAAAAATLHGGSGAHLDSIGAISAALTPLLGVPAGRLVFGLGVAGAAMVAAIVCSLALAWSVTELAGRRGDAWFRAGFALCLAAAALAVGFSRDLVWLSVASQIVNALLLPLVAVLLLALAARLPGPARLRGWYFWLVAGTAALASAAGVAGAFAGL